MLSTNDINSIKSIIREAGEAIMDEYAKDTEQSISTKGDDSPLTKADLRSNEIIIRGLLSLECSYPIVSEETKQMDKAKRMKIPTLWIVDPLDGTKEFISKNGEFAVCIALIHEKRVVAGFVYAPTKEELYYAVKDKGAILEKDHKREALQSKAFSFSDKNLRIAVSRSHRSEEQNEYMSQFDDPVFVTKGSVLKMTEIARGNIDIYPRFDEKTKEWDIAAGQIIVEEAGGEVIHKYTELPIEYNKESLQSPPFIARARII